MTTELSLVEKSDALEREARLACARVHESILPVSNNARSKRISSAIGALKRLRQAAEETEKVDGVWLEAKDAYLRTYPAQGKTITEAIEALWRLQGGKA